MGSYVDISHEIGQTTGGLRQITPFSLLSWHLSVLIWATCIYMSSSMNFFLYYFTKEFSAIQPTPERKLVDLKGAIIWCTAAEAAVVIPGSVLQGFSLNLILIACRKLQNQHRRVAWYDLHASDKWLKFIPGQTLPLDKISLHFFPTFIYIFKTY